MKETKENSNILSHVCGQIKSLAFSNDKSFREMLIRNGHESRSKEKPYCIIHGELSMCALAEKVNESNADGYEVSGSPFYDGNLYCWAMVKRPILARCG